MAGVTRVNGAAGAGEFVGRDLFFKTYTKGTAITQAEMEALVSAVELTATIEVIGAFVAGTSVAVNMVISGANTSNVADALVTGFTGSDIAGF